MNRFVPERFTSVRMLREDRHSKTFLADDHLLDREKVVVRIIRKDHERDRDKLIARLSWLTGVRHPYFADVLDAGVTKQQHLYYVRDYLTPFYASAVSFATLVEFLVSAIDFLCTRGQVHGAIKLSNIFVTAECIRLTDAKVVGHRVSDNEESVHFIAPEILQGRDISHEGDLYSLGAVLYLSLTGRHLFEDHDGSRLRSKYLCALPKPAPSFPGISQVVVTAISDLVSKNPEKRTAAFERIKRV